MVLRPSKTLIKTTDVPRLCQLPVQGNSKSVRITYSDLIIEQNPNFQQLAYLQSAGRLESYRFSDLLVNFEV